MVNVSITEAAMARRARVYGSDFPKAILAVAKEVAPNEFHLTLQQYVEITRSFRTRAGLGLNAQVAKVKVTYPPYVPKIKAKK